jgi:hypothetical protein
MARSLSIMASIPSRTSRTSSVACRPIQQNSSMNCCPTSGSRRTSQHGARQPRELAARGAESVATNPSVDGDALTKDQETILRLDTALASVKLGI